MFDEVNVHKMLPDLLCGVKTVDVVPDVRVSGLAMDSRHVRPGMLFAACIGASQHGLEYATRAEAAGAAAIVWEPDGHRQPPECHIPCVAVPDLSRHVGKMAADLYGWPSRRLFVTGVTGTDGKTSCAWLISQAFRQLGTLCGYMGTLGFGAVDRLAGASHTTPDATRLQYWLARMAGNDYQAVALEASSHALAQGRTDNIEFDVAVLTGIGRDHLDYHGSQIAYIAAKRRLFASPGLNWAVLNADDEVGRQWLAEPMSEAVCLPYGQTREVTRCRYYVRIACVQAETSGLTVDFETHLGSVRVESRLVGTFNAYNLAVALAVLLIRGIPLTSAAHALAAAPTVPGRMESVGARPERPLVVVDFAHTPAALEAALGALAPHVEGQLLCVFGCGGDRDRGKRPLMGAVVARMADRFWITDDNPRGEDPDAIVADVLEGIPELIRHSTSCRVVHSRFDAIQAAIAAAGPDDAVLIAGKGHEQTQQYGEKQRVFDDRCVARQILEAA